MNVTLAACSKNRHECSAWLIARSSISTITLPGYGLIAGFRISGWVNMVRSPVMPCSTSGCRNTAPLVSFLTLRYGVIGHAVPCG